MVVILQLILFLLLRALLIPVCGVRTLLGMTTHLLTTALHLSSPLPHYLHFPNQLPGPRHPLETPEALLNLRKHFPHHHRAPQ